MEINTDRLRLREISPGDMDDIHKLHSMPETDKYNTLGIPKTIQVTEKIVNEWLAGQNEEPQTSYVLCLSLATTNKFIGLIALNVRKSHYKVAEVWYKIYLDYWGHGYTTEALISSDFTESKQAAQSRILLRVGCLKKSAW